MSRDVGPVGPSPDPTVQDSAVVFGLSGVGIELVAGIVRSNLVKSLFSLMVQATQIPVATFSVVL